MVLILRLVEQVSVGVTLARILGLAKIRSLILQLSCGKLCSILLAHELIGIVVVALILRICVDTVRYVVRRCLSIANIPETIGYVVHLSPRDLVLIKGSSGRYTSHYKGI